MQNALGKPHETRCLQAGDNCLIKADKIKKHPTETRSYTLHNFFPRYYIYSK